MSTPEGKTKKMVRAVLEEFSEDITIGTLKVKTLYQYWPVPAGFGASSLDCIVGYYGRAIYIETKKPGGKPTPRQELTIAEVKGASCIALVIDGEKGCHDLKVLLGWIKDNACRPS